MPYVLSDEAIQFLEDNPNVAAQVAILLGLKTTSMATAIVRKSRSLNTWHTVELISQEMNKPINEILVKEK